MTKDEALKVKVWHDVDHRRWRVNGKAKTWKTRPDAYRIPIKFGLYAYGYVNEFHVSTYHDAATCEVKPEL